MVRFPSLPESLSQNTAVEAGMVIMISISRPKMLEKNVLVVYWHLHHLKTTLDRVNIEVTILYSRFLPARRAGRF